MRNFQCLLSVLKRTYICYYIICMTASLRGNGSKKIAIIDDFTKTDIIFREFISTVIAHVSITRTNGNVF